MTKLPEFSAVATREGKWWIVEVKDVGTTQGRTKAEALFMAVDMTVAMLQLNPDDFMVKIEFPLES